MYAIPLTLTLKHMSISKRQWQGATQQERVC